jgi:hypothetical protein
MKVLLPIVLALIVLVAVPSQASRRSECRQNCGPAITACQNACSSFRRHRCRTKCKKGLIRACVQQGAAACAITPPTTTTTAVVQPTTTTTTTLPNRLSLLIGRWAFTYTIISTFTDHYNLTSIQRQTGGFDGVVGTNTDLGNPVLAARIQDVDPGSTLPYEFGLLDPESFSLCEFFVFNLVGVSAAQGEVLFLDGQCETPLDNQLRHFNGSKY